MDLHINEIEKNGFTILKNQVENKKIAELKETLLSLREKFPIPDDATTPRLNKESDVIYNPDQKDRIFTSVLFSNKLLMDTLCYFLNDEYYRKIPNENPNFILRAMIARSSAKSPLPMHIDSFIPSSGKRPFVIQTSLVIDDQNASNGSTIIVPGSHLSDEYAPQEMFEKATPLVANSGDIVVWDSRLWHGALPNRSSNSRWSLIATFTRWWIKQNYNVTNSLPKAIYDDMSDYELGIMGFCSVPPNDEYDRIDIKSGYEILK